MKDEFVMVRRNVLVDACSFDDGTRLSAQHAIEALLAQPAEQHQGEPVALPERKPWNGLLATADNLRGEGWNACLDEIAKLGTLFSRPAQGEPVAWRYRHTEPGMSWFFTETPEANGCLVDGFKYEVCPLYASADPNASWKAVADEQMKVIEDLQRRIKNAELALKAQTQNRDTLRAQLSERNVLLRHLYDHNELSLGDDQLILAALSASAEPEIKS